jgi:hypothetical protein
MTTLRDATLPSPWHWIAYDRFVGIMSVLSLMDTRLSMVATIPFAIRLDVIPRRRFRLIEPPPFVQAMMP